MNERVYKRFAEVGLNIPFPQLDVHLKTKPGRKNRSERNNAPVTDAKGWFRPSFLRIEYILTRTGSGFSKFRLPDVKLSGEENSG